jgi:Putative MetA-pathway of phenol degradation
MMITTPNRTALALAFCGTLGASFGVHAQPDNQPASASPAAPDAPAAAASAPAPADARDALKKQAGDVDQSTLLKETLTKTDRQYSLLKAGRVAANYDLNYAYIGSESIDVGLDTTGAIDLFKIENTRSHTFTNSFSVDYGLLDNVTLSGTFPLVSKFTQSDQYSGIVTGIGDLNLSARYQPFVQKAGGPTFTFTGAIGLPTGRSPFRTVEGSNLSTGSGYATGTLGMNVSQVLDPVALFGSVNFTASPGVSHLNQVHVDGTVLTAVKPGKSIGWGAGFTYALSYNVSTSITFQETVTTASTLTYLDKSKVSHTRPTTQQTAAILNFGLGVRVNPKTTVNLSAGIGLTTDSPDFSLGLNVPLTFSLF